METHSHAEIAALESRNWWYATRRQLLGQLIDRYGGKIDTILDVGCGVGSNFPTLSARSHTVIGLDIAQDALDHTAPYHQKVLASIEEMPIAENSIDAIVCADVLEHVDDNKAVGELRRVLKPGGFAFITVPAFESLWNENDDYGHHLRRYRKNQLRAVFERNGFEIPYLYYWNRFPFFPIVWLVARMYTRGSKTENLKNSLSAIPQWMDGPLRAWMILENALARVVPLPFGVSLVLVARKK